MEGGCSKNTSCCKKLKKCLARVKVYSDKYGKFVIVNGEVFRLGKKINKNKLKNIIRKNAGPKIQEQYLPAVKIPVTTSATYSAPEPPPPKNTVSQDYTKSLNDGLIPNFQTFPDKPPDYYFPVEKVYPEFGDAKKDETYPQATGRGKVEDEKGMSDLDIDRIMNKYPEYLGTISHDEIKSRILPEIRPKSRFCFIINTDPRSKPGQHWQCFYVDGRPEGEHEIDFFDSYADPIDEKLLRDVKLMADKVNSGSYLKLKENMIKLQNAKSSNCGWFCCQFLIDRLRGKRFPEASKFSDVIRGEASVEHFKKQHGGFVKYIPSFENSNPEMDFVRSQRNNAEAYAEFKKHQEGEALPTFYTYYPPSVRRYMTDEPVTSLQVARLPISRGLDKALNIASLGGWKKALKEEGYDEAFHLYFIINGKYRLERNHTITMFPYSPDSGEQKINVPLKPGITIKSMLEKTAQQVGPDLQRYDGRHNNCQIFILQVLRANGLGNDAITKFTNQNIEQIVKKLPWYARWVSSISKGVTDVAHRVQHVIEGDGKRKRRVKKAKTRSG